VSEIYHSYTTSNNDVFLMFGKTILRAEMLCVCVCFLLGKKTLNHIMCVCRNGGKYLVCFLAFFVMKFQKLWKYLFNKLGQTRNCNKVSSKFSQTTYIRTITTLQIFTKHQLIVEYLMWLWQYVGKRCKPEKRTIMATRLQNKLFENAF
jgi:hypothetical protein